MESTLRGPVPPGLKLIETFGWWPGEGARRLELHMARMAASAAVLGWGFDLDAARATVSADGDHPLRCRLTFDGTAFELQATPFEPETGPWRVVIAGQRLRSDDPWLQHKTTRREAYERARAALPDGVQEAILLNERGELCDGTITNLFLTRRDGRVVTPALRSGLLPGILRQEMLLRGLVEEAVLMPDDLHQAKRVQVGNSLRGLIEAELR